jgi:hypothetical protein
LLSVAGALVIAGGIVATAVPASAAPTAVDVTHDTVTCNTVVGTIKFATGLMLTGATTGANQVNVKATLAGCTDNTNSSVHVAPTKLSVNLTSNGGNSCLSLSGPSAEMATSTIKWKASDPTVEKLTMSDLHTPAATTDNINATTGGTYNSDTWGATYGDFSVSGAQQVVTGSFVGTDAGASSTFQATTGQDIGAIVAECGGIHGLKAINFGIGGITFG